MNLVNLFDFEAAARSRMPAGDYDFIAGGAGDELTIKRTRAVLDSLLLLPRRLADVSRRDPSTTVLGDRIRFPVVLAPAGGHRLVHEEGELASVRAAGAAGVAMALSPGSTYVLEDVANQATGALWWQQYLFKDRGLTLDMAQRAQDSGCKAICITLDTIGTSRRERSLRAGYVPQEGKNSSMDNYKVSFMRLRKPMPDSVADLIDLSATWADFEWLAGKTALPLVAKGVLIGEDARLCGAHGGRGIVVSTHGGRNLDGVVTAIEALPEVVEAAGGEVEVYVDGGIRRGADILKALALGARAVLVGRPVFWGLAVGGQDGVRNVLEILLDEFDLAMALCGRANVTDIDASLLTSPSVS